MPIVHRANKAKIPRGWAYDAPLAKGASPASLDSISLATELGRMVAIAREDEGERTERLAMSPTMGAAVVTRDPARPLRLVVTLAAQSTSDLAEDRDWLERLCKKVLASKEADIVYADTCQVLLDASDETHAGLFSSLELPTNGPGDVALCLHTTRKVIAEPGRLLSKAVAERLRSTDPERWVVHLPVPSTSLSPQEQARVLEVASKTGAMLEVAGTKVLDAEWAGHGFAYATTDAGATKAIYMLIDADGREESNLEALVIAEATRATQCIARRLKAPEAIPWTAKLPGAGVVSGQAKGGA